MDKGVKANITWAICVLVALLIFTWTVRMPQSQRLTDLVGFAATVSSLILAVYAIFQTALASNEGARSASEARVLNERTAALLEGINQSLPEIRTGVADIKEKVSAVGYSQSAAAQNENLKAGKTEADADVLLKSSSPMGLVAIQAAILSYRHGKRIPFSLFDSETMWHSLGVISALSASKWMEFSFDGNEPLYVEVTDVVPSLVERYGKIIDLIQLQPVASDAVVKSNKLSAFFSLPVDQPAANDTTL